MASIKIFSLFVAIALQGQAVLGQSCASKDFSQSVCGLVTFEGSKPVKFEVQLAEVDSSGQFSCDQQLTKMCCATDFKLGVSFYILSISHFLTGSDFRHADRRLNFPGCSRSKLPKPSLSQSIWQTLGRLAALLP
ncbi:hypothetical protein PSTT_03107 [Puccinia striiformis]|uniref:Hydrophobin n=1 Tax=Puccinia striiformis TaxID=27350 RepID=A0A2S4VXN6_9BASI|nr:hypothetical protein PSTT_03107 [Puccinia striiformis]